MGACLCCGITCRRKVDISHYDGFHEEEPPSPTNECDEAYLNSVGETATFGLGHFWRPQAIFSVEAGVVRTRVGYSGGTVQITNLDKIGDHTEVVDIEYDPSITPYCRLLEIFWKSHDPTEATETRYHSKIFYHNKEQKREAERELLAKDQEYKNSMKHVRTDLERVKHIFLAKPEDQHYFLKEDGFLARYTKCKTPEQFIYSHQAAKLNGFIGGCNDLSELEAQADDLCVNTLVIIYLKEEIEKKLGYYDEGAEKKTSYDDYMI